MPSVTPYGAWPSPLDAARVARAGTRPRFVRIGSGGTVWWDEERPAEGGRVALVRDGDDVLPAGWSTRTLVHEYGGRSFEPVGGGVVFAAWEDQRLYRLLPGEQPVPLTPEPPAPRAWRYAEPVVAPGGAEMLCIREVHGDSSIRRHVVAIPLDGSQRVREVVGGSDFLAAPRPAPDGRHLAWTAWDHPRMPWDGSEVRVGELVDGVVSTWRALLGGPTESAGFAEWADADTLYAASDRTGWWNLYRVRRTGAVEPLHPAEDEFAVPLWLLGFTPYAVLGDGRVAALSRGAAGRLGLLDSATGGLEDVSGSWTTWYPVVHARGSTLAAVAASPTEPPTVLRIETGSEPGATAITPVSPATDRPPPGYLPVPRHETFAGPGGRDVHAVVWPPHNPDAFAPAGELPPYIVFVHGGPTSAVHDELDLEIAYFTSRGLGVINVNYGGSTGYGRAYRERLREQWGVVDVEDCVAAARGLVERGEADGARLAIRGGSAGGWTTLAALTRTDVFAAGTSYYGVAELLRFASDTHDFESRYLDGLIGPLPQARDRYVERAPLTWVDGLSCPVLLLQGLEDEVVPPSQAEMFRDALVRKRIPHAYLAFAGEQHGFRKAETVVTCLEAEMSFYGQVFGFDPPGVPRLALTVSDDLSTAR
jgi:dipeptidyl aminopeptidase/acylaminoacyl peptidase